MSCCHGEWQLWLGVRFSLSLFLSFPAATEMLFDRQTGVSLYFCKGLLSSNSFTKRLRSTNNTVGALGWCFALVQLVNFLASSLNSIWCFFTLPYCLLKQRSMVGHRSACRLCSIFYSTCRYMYMYIALWKRSVFVKVLQHKCFDCWCWIYVSLWTILVALYQHN